MSDPRAPVRVQELQAEVESLQARLDEVIAGRDIQAYHDRLEAAEARAEVYEKALREIAEYDASFTQGMTGGYTACKNLARQALQDGEGRE